LLTADEHTDLARALTQIAADHLDRPCPDSDAEDLHTWIEGVLTALVGDAGRRIHTARSRNDQVATLLVMYALSANERLQSRLAQLITALCSRAKSWSDLVMPLQTHQQFAAPGTVGYWALRFAASLARIRAHLAFLADHWRSACPLGSAAVAGSTLPVDRRIQSANLGFTAPSLSALASTSARDECLELLAVLAQIALYLQAFAADVIAFSQTPLAWTKYPPQFGTGSSMMPNKTNPDAMELLRGDACAILTAHAHALTLLKGLPSGYNRDLQGIKPLLRDTVEKTLNACELLTAFVAALDFSAEHLLASARLGNIDATARMEAQVAAGTPLREAHHAVAETLSTAPATPEALTAIVHAYRTIGSASPAETRRVADELLAQLARTE